MPNTVACQADPEVHHNQRETLTAATWCTPLTWAITHQPIGVSSLPRQPLLHQLLFEMSIVSCRKAGITHACGKSYSEMLLLMLLMLLMLFMSCLW